MSGDLVVVKNMNVGGLAKPVTTLVNRVSDALSGPFRGAFRPMQIRRVAEAEADAIRILTQADADAVEIRLRTAERVLAGEMRNQVNMESILGRAIPHVTEEAEPERMEDDWIVNFFEKCRIVSDEQMQELWARILAGEASYPGTFSRKTVNIMEDMDKLHADLFTNLLGFRWQLPQGPWPIVYSQDELWRQQGINQMTLADLQSLGLVQANLIGVFINRMPQTMRASYFGTVVELTLSGSAAEKFDLGDTQLTSAGDQLSRVCQPTPVAGVLEEMVERWKGRSGVESVKVLD